VPATSESVRGLREFRSGLKAAGAEYPKELRRAHKEIADLVAARARGIAEGLGGIQTPERSRATRRSSRRRSESPRAAPTPRPTSHFGERSDTSDGTERPATRRARRAKRPNGSAIRGIPASLRPGPTRSTTRSPSSRSKSSSSTATRSSVSLSSPASAPSSDVAATVSPHGTSTDPRTDHPR